MTGDQVAAAAPLRPGDPHRLGSYELVGRLGEGGMGTVYLARTDAGRLVAVKMIRSDLAPDREFRRRFRGEVNRARQVPPFCTAEVIDADADHEPPYLVVEYVDGPSLAAVVEQRGPLTPANLHGVAIGVATALTAIHGAGVIHRDLKPTNVLLAPGSPKVIDFGIARALTATSQHTGINQMLGTVAYMAPERFGPASASTLTPAADVFAWGAVVAYAGTGRNPFAAQTPPLVAVRILTDPPDLTGLQPPLRGLVAAALAKDHTDRPAARELLDLLLSAGPSHAPVVAAALADQPELRVAAQGAQAATEHGPAAELTAAAAAIRPAAVDPGGPAAGAELLVAEQATIVLPVPADGVPTQRLPVHAPTAPAPAGPPRRAGRKWKLLVLVAVLTLLATALAVPTTWRKVPSTLSASPGAEPAAAPALPVDGDVLTRDALLADGLWSDRVDRTHDTTCIVERGLTVRRTSPGTYRCPGPPTTLTDFTATVDVRLLTPGSCAGIWFRFTGTAGYALRICTEGYYLATHGFGTSSTITTLRAFAFDQPIRLDTPTRVGLWVAGETVQLYRDDRWIGRLQDGTFDRGRLSLGIFQDDAEAVAPFSVAFHNIEIRD